MVTLLLVSAALLGFLAFFEPCTIATHTLFSAHLNKKEDKQHCCYNLFALWLSRSVLLVVIQVLAVYFIAVPNWGEVLPSVILFAIAMIYLISRFVYIPIPHLEFYKLLPVNKNLSDAIKLGLTIPACTLPLIVLITGMSVTLGSILYAALAGILFSSLFTLPLIVTSIKGINENSRDFLQRAAKGSPFLTSVLLIGLALILLNPGFDINIQQMKENLQQASWAGIGISFTAGFIFSFNPVSFASIPVMLAYVTKSFDDKEHEERRALLMGGAFVAGMIMTHIALGVIAALGGDWVKSILGRQWGLFLGPLLIVMGLMWSGWLKIRLPWFGVKGKRVTGLWGAFLLGIPFSVAVCPFCTPALMVALTASAAIGSVSFGLALLFAFALGRSVPIILGAWSMGWLESLKVIGRYQKVFEVIAGLVLIVMGLYLLNEYFFIM
jgi:cytochrome c-type biogenesis protein